MKKIIFLIMALCTIAGVKAQLVERLSFATTVGTGIAMSSPSSTPFTWQIVGHYHFNRRLSAGVGTGLSFHEKTLIPVFADVKFDVTRPRRFTPYLGCGVGYSFALDKNARGGFYLNPSVGVQYPIGGRKKLLLAIGYEQQKLERLEKKEIPHFTAEFRERLQYSSVSFKVGFVF